MHLLAFYRSLRQARNLDMLYTNHQRGARGERSKVPRIEAIDGERQEEEEEEEDEEEEPPGIFFFLLIFSTYQQAATRIVLPRRQIC